MSDHADAPHVAGLPGFTMNDLLALDMAAQASVEPHVAGLKAAARELRADPAFDDAFGALFHVVDEGFRSVTGPRDREYWVTFRNVSPSHREDHLLSVTLRSSSGGSPVARMVLHLSDNGGRHEPVEIKGHVPSPSDAREMFVGAIGPYIAGPLASPGPSGP